MTTVRLALHRFFGRHGVPQLSNCPLSGSQKSVIPDAPAQSSHDHWRSHFADGGIGHLWCRRMHSSHFLHQVIRQRLGPEVFKRSD
jgi:hypothetical protein